MSRPLAQSLVLPLFALGLASCDTFAISGSGNLKTIEPSLSSSETTEFTLDSGLEAYVSRGEDKDLRITGDDNLLDELIIEERDRGLYIGLPHSVGGYRPTRSILVEITLPELEQVVGSGGCQITLDSNFRGESLSLKLDGGGTLESQSLEAKSVDIEASGGGQVKLKNVLLDALRLELSGGGEGQISGQVETLEAHLSGGGDLEALGCEARAVSLELDGGADASVHATELLDVEASGGGTITYRGDPETIHQELSGGAELEEE